MYDKQDSPTISKGAGCAGTIGLAIAWILGFILSFTGALMGAGGGLLGPRTDFLGVGAVIFALILSIAHFAVLIVYLSRNDYWRLITITFFAGIGYWLVAVVIYRFLWQNGVFGLVKILQKARRDSTSEIFALALISLVGGCAGLVGGAILTIPQWLLLRKHIRKATLWPIPIIIGSALMAASFYYAVYWFSQGSSWN